MSTAELMRNTDRIHRIQLDHVGVVCRSHFERRQRRQDHRLREGERPDPEHEDGGDHTV